MHDTLGHFGVDKSYAVLRDLFYWPKMRKCLEVSYIPLCNLCQRNKSSTKRLMGPLHPLPILDVHGDSVAIDFVGPLPEDGGFNYLVMMMDRLNSDIWLVPTHTTITVAQLVDHFSIIGTVKMACLWILWVIMTNCFYLNSGKHSTPARHEVENVDSVPPRDGP